MFSAIQYIHTHTHTHTYIHTYICMYIHTYVCTYIHRDTIWPTHIFTCVYIIHTFTHADTV